MKTGTTAQPAGLVLAAGAGTRMGRPKALLRRPDGTPWLAAAVDLLLAGGCEPVVVVLGAQAGAARELLPVDARVTVTIAADWEDGMGASLRAGMRELSVRAAGSIAVAITLVDLPGLTPSTVDRLTAAAGRATLAQAAYRGRPGHPVVVGRDHWAAFTESLRGDEGGRAYLRAHHAELVECSDLADGSDVDTMAHDDDTG